MHTKMPVLLETCPHVDYWNLKIVQSVHLKDQEQQVLRKKLFK